MEGWILDWPGHNVHDLHSKGMKNAKLFHEDLLSKGEGMTKGKGTLPRI